MPETSSLSICYCYDDSCKMDDWDLDIPSAKSETSAGPTDGPAASPDGPTASSDRLPPSPVMKAGAGATTRGRVSRWIRSRAPWIAVALGALVVGVLVGFFVSDSQSADDAVLLSETRVQLGELQRALKQAESRNWDYYRENEALRTELDAARAGEGGSSTTTTEIVPDGPTTFGDGIYLVGEDIPPGDYDGTVRDETGYWARLQGTDGSAGSIIVNGLVRGPFVLTVQPGDKALELRGVTLTGR